VKKVDEISIHEIFGIIRKRIIYIILVPLIITLCVGVYYFGYAKNQYTAESKLYVLIDYEDTTGNMRYDVTTSTSFAGDYQQLITTHEVLTAAAQRLGVDDLDDVDIEVSSQSNTRVLNLSVVGTDPVFCMNVANTISEVFIDYMSSITQTNSISIASRALLPERPSGPSRVRNTAVAFLAALFAAAAFFIVIEVMNTTIRTSEDVEENLNLPVLARITGYEKEATKFLSQKGSRKPLYYVVSRNTREGIKTLAMNLQFASMGSKIKTLAITSATPNEGKSTVSIMLGTALAEEGKNVLLVDMDFRNPSVGKFLGKRNKRDLIDALNGTEPLSQVISDTHVNGLYMIDSAHKRVLMSNVVQSPQYRDFIDLVSKDFDYIIFDTPPVGMFIDSAVMANVADRTLLVIASGRVDRALGKDVVDQLQKANASIVGVALNFVDDRHGHYSGYYYYKNYYRKQYSEDSLA
jgi:succinoglycan biosynthesis transport protein ExoP